MSLVESAWLALGDSYTLGEGVASGDRWPMQLAEMLNREGVAVAEPTIIAQTGWTTGDLLAALDSSPPAGTYQLVTLQIGVNNQFQELSEEAYAEELEALLQLAVRFAGGHASRVLVLSIPDWGVTPFAGESNRSEIAKGIDAFNRQKRSRAHHLGIGFVDVTPASRQIAGDRTLLADDGLHPSRRMYERWSTMALPAARKAFVQ